MTEAHWRAWAATHLTPYLEVGLAHFGPGRLLIGSDWPVYTLAGTYGGVMAIVVDGVSALSADEQAAVWAGTRPRSRTVCLETITTRRALGGMPGRDGRAGGEAGLDREAA